MKFFHTTILYYPEDEIPGRILPSVSHQKNDTGLGITISPVRYTLIHQSRGGSHIGGGVVITRCLCSFACGE